MNAGIHELAKAIFKKPLEDCSLEELQQVTRQYPYFGPAQFLLAKKLSVAQPGKSSMYDEQVQKTSLYFPNRVWLDHLLRDHTNNNTVSNVIVTKEDQPAQPEERYQPAETMNSEPMNAEIIAEPVKETTTDQQPVFSETDPAPVESAAEQPIGEFKEPEQLPEINKEDISELKPAPSAMQDLAAQEETANKEFLFEPYHTVDYFASQGIKFREEEKPKDRFSVQLKSFTEWLKTLKKTPSAEIAAAGDPRAEKKIEQMAEYSIAERHVITEAMAEVWRKQGNRAKAEEIYRKLSLLDPSKSSYFAAKIDELKKTS